MPKRYETPQTEDGRIVGVEEIDNGLLNIKLSFDITGRFRERCDGLWQHVRFVTRSRVARLGIDVRPISSLVFTADSAHLTATVEAVVQTYPVKRHLSHLMVEGLSVGRLVLCDPSRRLTGSSVYSAVTEHQFQLPAPVSIDSQGNVTIRPHRCIYELQHNVSGNDLLGFLTREDGKAILDRMQLRRDVDHIILKPDDGIITSCTMFLHKHFALLDARSASHGQHLGATILDPVTTRGTRIFLEFANQTGMIIVNPEVSATIYAADEICYVPRRWFGWSAPDESDCGNTRHGSDHDDLAAFYRAAPFVGNPPSYGNRPVAVISDLEEARITGKPQLVFESPKPRANLLLSSDRLAVSKQLAISTFSALRELEPKSSATVLLEYFPSQVEHLQLCLAALDERILRIVFHKASFEHGPFLSARDHGRLADYEALGVEIVWFNEMFNEPALHVFRGSRGFFVPFRHIETFRASLIFAIYGSTLPLPERQFGSLSTLLEKLQQMFDGQVAFLTGGGPGAMKQAADIARRLDLMVGCNYLETVDQELQESVQFYQTFQGTARHFRQRWFDIASFHLFCIGGVGTMEEIGLTLTDMKLGVIEPGPLVFFGSMNSCSYWDDLRKQLNKIEESNRGPSWLKTHVLFTDDPEEVVSFYERILEIGMYTRH